MSTSSARPAYDQLCATFLRLHRFEHVTAIAGWDQSTYMPNGGSEARGAALGEMAALTHRIRTDPSLAQQLTVAEQEPLDELQRANLREMRRAWRTSNALPEALVQDMTVATSRCEHAWRTLRPANDWKGFLTPFREVVQLARREATLLAEALGLSKYDALMDRYEPGMTCAQVDRVFGDLKTWLPGLITAARAKQSLDQVVQPAGPFTVAAQRALCERVMKVLEFDFDRGRLDVSAHPFSGGVPEDVRLTTRYRDDEFMRSLMGTIHETGHGRYEQSRPRELLGQPVSDGRSMAIHESQSLSFEMQLGRSKPFVMLIAPLVQEAFGVQPATAAENLLKLMTRVEPGLIRVDADEVTYPAHVVLRYEIERALIEGDIECEDIPTLWDEKMKRLLGLDTRGNFTDGPLQDVHWPAGLFGYFPCYTLGAIYAAQWFATVRRLVPDLDGKIASGDLAPLFDWLRDNIWLAASRYPTNELCSRASGETLDARHFRAHLEARYLG